MKTYGEPLLIGQSDLPETTQKIREQRDDQDVDGCRNQGPNEEKHEQERYCAQKNR